MNPSRPSHWQSYVGPSNWYRVWHPPEWRVSESSGAVRFVSSDARTALTLLCHWSHDGEHRDIRSAFDPRRAFPKHRRVRPMDGLTIGAESTGLEGEAQAPASGSWWKRLLSRNKWFRWRVWAVRQGPVCVVAMHVDSDVPDPEGLSLARMILRTLELAEQPADPPDVFTQRVLDLAREKFPLLKCERGDSFQLEIADSKVNLFNFYRSYVNAPDKFREIMLPALATVVQVQEWGTSQTEPKLEQVRERIMPMLYPLAVWSDRLSEFVAYPWVAGLVILYVVDEAQAYWYIRDDLLKTWGLSHDELHRLALTNLDRYFEDNAMEFMLSGPESGPHMLMPSRPDAYNTSRLLSEPFHERLQGVLGRELVIGIPNRDFFVAFDVRATDLIEPIHRKIRGDFAQMDHPLTDRLLLISRDGVSEFVPDPLP